MKIGTPLILLHSKMSLDPHIQCYNGNPNAAQIIDKDNIYVFIKLYIGTNEASPCKWDNVIWYPHLKRK